MSPRKWVFLTVIVVLADLEDRYDPRMIQRCQGCGQ
mgnify:CR=1 FL=1